MKTAFRFIFCLFLTAFSISILAQPAAFTTAKSPADAGFSADRLKRIDELMQGFIDKGMAPNAVTFVARNGKIIHYKGFGYSNVEKKTPLKRDDIYRIASQTKALVTVVLMTLFEEGKFMLDEPISNYIPAFKNPKVLVSVDKEKGTYETRPAKSEITIRQLISHNAGIPYDHPLADRPEFKVPFYNSLQPDKLEDVVNRIAARPLTKDPGDGFVYGLNIDIIGRLVEILAKKPLDVALRERLLEPLGMTDTYFYLPANKANRLVEVYSKTSGDKPLTLHENKAYRSFSVEGAQTYFSGGAGLVGTIEDYARFCQMMLNGGTFNNKRILGRKTVEMMLRNQIGDSQINDYKDKFGLGFLLVTPTSSYGNEASPGTFGAGGMYCSEYTIDPSENLILLVFTNVQPYAHSVEFRRKFRMAVYQALN